MRRLVSLAPVGAIVFGSALAALSFTYTPPASAQACAVDAGGGCLNDGKKCNPPAGGKCYTVKEKRVLNCVCATKKPPNALRIGEQRPRRSTPPRETPPAEPK